MGHTRQLEFGDGSDGGRRCDDRAGDFTDARAAVSTNDAVNSLTSGNDDLLNISGRHNLLRGGVESGQRQSLRAGFARSLRALSITGNVNWTGGGFSGTATTTLAPSSTLAISGAGGKFLENGELVNAGSANWSGSNNSINMGGTPAATFTNSGTFAIQGDITLSGLGNFFRNTGTFTSSGGTALFRSTFDNSGSVSVTSGTLQPSRRHGIGRFYRGVRRGRQASRLAARRSSTPAPRSPERGRTDSSTSLRKSTSTPPSRFRI